MTSTTREKAGARPHLRDLAIKEVRRTHVSWLFFTNTRVYKLKKPVSFGFLDFRSPEARREACHTEVRLNRRLAGGVYVGVRHARRGQGGELRLGGECRPSTCTGEDEHLVEMLRLPARRALSSLAARGRLDENLLAALAETIAEFHRRAPGGDDVSRFGSPEAVAALVHENLEELRPFAGSLIDPSLFLSAADVQRRFIEERRLTLEARRQAGGIRDGHGDLHMEHVFDLAGTRLERRLKASRWSPPGRFAIIDCIEFSDRFRCADVAADVAFLAMSLMMESNAELAESWLASYAAAALDYEMYRVVDFYVMYRALVRLKVACLSGSAAGVDSHQGLVRRLLRRPRAPALFLVGGPVGSGKSTVARGLCARLGAVLVGSDAVRKRMLGLPPTERAGAPTDRGAYSPAITERVYELMTQAARAVLDSGRPVVLDATWPTVERRAPALDAARKLDVPYLFVNLGCDKETARARLRGRECSPGVVSDARARDVDALWDRYQPPAEIDRDHRIDLDTSRLGERQAVREIILGLDRGSVRVRR